MQAFVLGNGPSRKAVNPHTLLAKGTVFACNAAYRDFTPHYLVAIDEPMIKQIRLSDFPQHRFLVPPFFEHWEPAALHGGNNPPRSNAGVNAVMEALKREFSPVTLIGFDFLLVDEEQCVANIYDGTPGYEMERRATKEDSIPRANYLGHAIQTLGRETPIRIVVPDNATVHRINLPNVTYVPMTKFLGA